MSFYFVWGIIMTKIGITGWRGMVGQELLKYPDTLPLMGDVRYPDDIELSIKSIRPDIIVHLASISDVDVCGIDENEKLVTDTNVRGTYNVCEIASRYGCKVVLLSSVQVFDGIWGNYNEKNKPYPKNFYGYSKFAAESLRTVFDNLKVVRTSYLFDYRRLFPDIYALRSGVEISEPMFLYRSFMYLPHFAESFYQYLMNIDEMPNMLHISGRDTVSWYTFIKELAEIFRLDKSLVCSRSNEVQAAPRPYKGGLNVGLSKKLGLPQYGYREGLLAMRELI